MLRSANELHGYTLHATDGDLGHVEEFYFDDEKWTVRYLVVNTGGWLLGRRVLISPVSFREVDWEDRGFHVSLTREQVENSPAIDTEAPVSRQHEAGYYRYYGWPVYWTGAGLWGAAMYPALLVPPPSTVAMAGAGATAAADAREDQKEDADTHLRSTKEVSGYAIEATDGELGHLEDFILDDETWQVRYLAVDTRNWWPGKKVLVPPDRIQRVSWFDRQIDIDLTREQLRNAPEWNPDAPISADFTDRLHAYFARDEEERGGRLAA